MIACLVLTDLIFIMLGGGGIVVWFMFRKVDSIHQDVQHVGALIHPWPNLGDCWAGACGFYCL